ncbi:hypothetical protein B0H66DRAFT_335835 [Apodospora peruviana]|uniref:Myb-like DNA-binding domain-containing protein n=1 Tax=Apodospora peruviana TaxID=516989 RepID=A0AAE0HYD1_9PEZI|nr:hypothetical protein B0H66DRAFT_335835 [Apodospora peruviana]
MSSKDSQSTMLLLAMLQQISQKDLARIDWDMVANNPILPQKISNGHAARMRWHRLRNSVVGGDEPAQRRARASTAGSDTKSRVSKKRKGDKSVKANDSTKPELFVTEQQRPGPTPTATTSTTTTTDTYARVNHNSINSMRLPTPASDSDALGTPQAFPPSPTSELLHTNGTFDFPGAPHGAWQSSYTGFGGYDLNTYSTAFDDHPHHPQHAAEELAMLEHEAAETQVMVKHEDWDHNNNSNQLDYDQHGHC